MGELKEVIEDAYRVFARYRASSPLVVCDCGFCLTKEYEAALLSTPLRQISAHLLREYHRGLYVYSGAFNIQFRYFLPRIMEMIADGRADDINSIGLPIALQALGHLDWRRTWPQDQVAVLDRFFAAFAAAERAEPPKVHVTEHGARLASEFASVLSFVVTAGGNTATVLEDWDAASDPAAALHMLGARWRVKNDETGMPYLADSFLKEYRDATKTIGAFLARPEVDERIERAFFDATDPNLQSAISVELDWWRWTATLPGEPST